MLDSSHYASYLESKRSVDDRSLNRELLSSLSSKLVQLQEKLARPLRILDLGGGTGSMLRRCVEWGVISKAQYRLIDAEPQVTAQIPELLSQFCADNKLNLTRQDSSENNVTLLLKGKGSDNSELELELSIGTVDLYDELAKKAEPYDLVIAHAFLDLVDLSTFLPALWPQCHQDTLLWFTLNFDGVSTFLPRLPEDEEFISIYHQSMNRRPGGSESSQALFVQLRGAGARILSAGSSDWVVFAQSDTYPENESDFLAHILNTINIELQSKADIDRARLESWMRQRRSHLSSGDLVYIAHQLDFLAHPPIQGNPGD